MSCSHRHCRPSSASIVGHHYPRPFVLERRKHRTVPRRQRYLGPEASATSGAAQPRTHESLIDPFSCVRAGCRRGLDNPHLRRRRLAATGSRRRRRRRINSYTSRPDTTEQFARTRHHPWSDDSPPPSPALDSSATAQFLRAALLIRGCTVLYGVSKLQIRLPWPRSARPAQSALTEGQISARVLLYHHPKPCGACCCWCCWVR